MLEDHGVTHNSITKKTKLYQNFAWYLNCSLQHGIQTDLLRKARMLFATTKASIEVVIIKSKFMQVMSIPYKPIKDTKTKECTKLKLVTNKPIRQFRIKGRI